MQQSGLPSLRDDWAKIPWAISLRLALVNLESKEPSLIPSMPSLSVFLLK